MHNMQYLTRFLLILLSSRQQEHLRTRQRSGFGRVNVWRFPEMGLPHFIHLKTGFSWIFSYWGCRMTSWLRNPSSSLARPLRRSFRRISRDIRKRWSPWGSLGRWSAVEHGPNMAQGLGKKKHDKTHENNGKSVENQWKTMKNPGKAVKIIYDNYLWFMISLSLHQGYSPRNTSFDLKSRWPGMIQLLQSTTPAWRFFISPTEDGSRP